MKIFLSAALSLALALLASCTTLDDFKGMTPAQRADLVCGQDGRITSLTRQIQLLDSRTRSAQAALTRGYRVHRQCRLVPEYGPATVRCTEFGHTTECRERRPVGTVEQCTELPVSISPELERSNIAEWAQSRQALRQELDGAWSQCRSVLLQASPEEAYRRYQ